MGIQRKKNWNQVRNVLTRNVRDATAKSGVILQAEIKAELSKPGTGRFYARNKGTRRIAGRHGELSRQQVTSLLANENRRVATAALKGGLGGRKMRSLRSLGVHRASAPGHPPAVDKGHLRRSIQIDVSRLTDPNPRVRTGTNVNYAKGLEYGTRRVARRPYMRPAAKKARLKIAQFWRAHSLLRGLGAVIR